MKSRGFATATVLSLSLAAGLSLGAFFSGWGWVDVQTRGEDAVHIALPLPMDLLPLAAACMPDEACRDEGFQEFLRHKEAVLGLLDRFRDCPDACLVKVQSPEENVEISKKGDCLLIRVAAPDADVFVRMPLGPIVRTLKALDAPVSKVIA